MLFADDLKLFLPINNTGDRKTMQRDIDEVVSWSVQNKLSLNICKFKAITFMVSRSPIITTFELEGEPSVLTAYVT